MLKKKDKTKPQTATEQLLNNTVVSQGHLLWSSTDRALVAAWALNGCAALKQVI